MENLIGYTFDAGVVSSAADAALYSFLSGGVETVLRPGDFAVSFNRMNVVVAPGRCVVQGRMIELKKGVSLEAPPSARSYLVLEVDLSKTNTATGDISNNTYKVDFKQLNLKIITATPVYANLNTNNTGRLQLIIATITSGGSSIQYIEKNEEFLSGVSALYTKAAYPVGSIYMNASSEENPVNLLGFGTWVRLEDVFPWGKNSNGNVGEISGSNLRTLTSDYLPISEKNFVRIEANSDQTFGVGKKTPSVLDIKPKHVVVAMWKRVS